MFRAASKVGCYLFGPPGHPFQGRSLRMPSQIQPDGPGTVAGTRTQPGRRGSALASLRPGLADFAWRMVVAVLILALAYLLWRGVHVLLLAFAGILFAVFLSALSGWLNQRMGWA